MLVYGAFDVLHIWIHGTQFCRPVSYKIANCMQGIMVWSKIIMVCFPWLNRWWAQEGVSHYNVPCEHPWMDTICGSGCGFQGLNWGIVQGIDGAVTLEIRWLPQRKQGCRRFLVAPSSVLERSGTGEALQTKKKCLGFGHTLCTGASLLESFLGAIAGNLLQNIFPARS